MRMSSRHTSGRSRSTALTAPSQSAASRDHVEAAAHQRHAHAQADHGVVVGDHDGRRVVGGRCRSRQDGLHGRASSGRARHAQRAAERLRVPSHALQAEALAGVA